MLNWLSKSTSRGALTGILIGGLVSMAASIGVPCYFVKEFAPYCQDGGGFLLLLSVLLVMVPVALTAFGVGLFVVVCTIPLLLVSMGTRSSGDPDEDGASTPKGADPSQGRDGARKRWDMSTPSETLVRWFVFGMTIIFVPVSLLAFALATLGQAGSEVAAIPRVLGIIALAPFTLVGVLTGTIIVVRVTPLIASKRKVKADEADCSKHKDGPK